MKKLDIATTKRQEFLEITSHVQKAVSETGINAGICYIFVPHTTCGLTINENADPSVPSDIISTLRKLIPSNGGYEHTEGNSDAHIISGLIGHSLSVFIENGSVMLGTWQGIFLYELDGPRTRQIWIKAVQGDNKKRT